MFCEKQEKTKYHSGLFNMTKGGGGIGGVATTFMKGGQGQIICYLYFNLDISDSWHLCHTYQCKLTNKNSSALVYKSFMTLPNPFFVMRLILSLADDHAQKI